jgi:Sec-independent protein secretion pathway component TatC
MSERLVPISFPWRRFALAALFGAGCYLLAELVSPQDLLLSILARCLLLLLLAFALYFSPVVGREERCAINNTLKEMIARLRRKGAPRQT